MNDLISKSEVISAIESLISHYEWRLHDNSLSQEDFMVIISGKLNVLKEALISIKKIRPLNLASKSTWISCEERLPEKADGYLVYGTEYDFFSGKEIPIYKILQYEPNHKIWNTKAPVIITHWQSLSEPPKAEKAKEFSEEEIANWINCKYELPEHLKDVLVCTKNGVVIGAYYDEESKEWTITNSESRITNITHWQPLPEPPKGA